MRGKCFVIPQDKSKKQHNFQCQKTPCIHQAVKGREKDHQGSNLQRLPIQLYAMTHSKVLFKAFTYNKWSGTISVGTVTDPHASRYIDEHLFLWQSEEWVTFIVKLLKRLLTILKWWPFMRNMSGDWHYLISTLTYLYEIVILINLRN